MICSQNKTWPGKDGFDHDREKWRRFECGAVIKGHVKSTFVKIEDGDGNITGTTRVLCPECRAALRDYIGVCIECGRIVEMPSANTVACEACKITRIRNTYKRHYYRKKRGEATSRANSIWHKPIKPKVDAARHDDKLTMPDVLTNDRRGWR